MVRMHAAQRRLRTAILSITAFLSTAYGTSTAQPPADDTPPAGFWPTRAMMDGLYNQMMAGLESQYDLDVDQSEQIELILRDRIDRFLHSNRRELQELMNQYFEALLNTEVPEVEEVADWAARISPIIERFGQEMDAAAESMHELMTDEQREKLETNMAGFRTGMQMAQERMRVWADGGFDPSTEWPDGREFEEAERARQAETAAAIQAARESARERTAHAGPVHPEPAETVPDTPEPHTPRAESTTAPATAPAAPPDEWAEYVDQFIRRYDLNTEQQQQARRFLKQRQAQRSSLLNRRAADLARLGDRFRDATSPEEYEKAEREYNQLMKPVSDQFDRLKKQLETLPTREQRRRTEAAASP